MGQLKYTAWENGASCLKPRPCGAGSDSGKAANRRLPQAWAAPNSSQRTCAARTSAPGVCSHLGTRTSGAQGRCEGTRVHPMRMDARSPPAPVLAFPTPRTDWGSRGIIPRFASPAPRPPPSRQLWFRFPSAGGSVPAGHPASPDGVLRSLRGCRMRKGGSSPAKD